MRLLALGMIALTLAGTLIDLQLKLKLNATYDGDAIAAIYGYMSVAVGVGTLLLQLWASRVLFPKFGVSFAAKMQGGTLAIASGGVAVASGVWMAGGVWALAGLQSVEDILQHSLQKPVEQVSLLPFPRQVKGAVLATLGGVLRPLSKAAAGLIAVVLASRAELLPVLTVISAAGAFFIYMRHRPEHSKERSRGTRSTSPASGRFRWSSVATRSPSSTRRWKIRTRRWSSSRFR